MDRQLDRQQRAAVGRRIKEAREAQGLLQKDVMALTGVKDRTYRSIENGETVGQEANIAKIMEALGISPPAEPDTPPIWLELHVDDDLPDELKLYAKVAVRDWTAHLNDLLALSECDRMTQIAKRMRDWNESDVHTPTPDEIPLSD